MRKGHRNGHGMRDHYDFSRGVRGKYAKRYAEGTNVVVLDPDVADMFRDPRSVNETLRAVARIIHLQPRKRASNKPLQPTRAAKPIGKRRRRVAARASERRR